MTWVGIELKNAPTSFLNFFRDRLGFFEASRVLGEPDIRIEFVNRVELGDDNFVSYGNGMALLVTGTAWPYLVTVNQSGSSTPASAILGYELSWVKRRMPPLAAKMRGRRSYTSSFCFS